MKISTGVFLAVGLSVLTGYSPLSGQQSPAAVERLGTGKLSVETNQQGQDLIITLDSNLKDVIGLALSTPGEAGDLVRIQAKGHDRGTAPAKAVITSSGKTLAGPIQTLIEYDLSRAQELVLTVELSDGTTYPFHFRGAAVNSKVEVNLNGTLCMEWTLTCGEPHPCNTKATCCGLQAPCLDCRTCTITCPPCSLQTH